MSNAHPAQSSFFSQGEFIALVFDRDPISRLCLRSLLESEGGHVINVENGPDVVPAFRAHQPDIVILDNSGSGSDSFDICAELQAFPYSASTPILLITSVEDEASLTLAMNMGASDYVPKPICPAVLQQRIRRLLQVHRIDAAIVRAKKEWEAAFDAVDDLIILTDLNDKIIRCNLATIQRLETTYAQLIGNDLGSILLQNPGQKLNLLFGQPLEIQFSSLPGWFEVRTFPGQLEGRPHTIVYILKDITERKKLEENLHKSEQRFRSLTENISEGIMLYDAVGTILYLSPTVTRLSGYGQEIIGKNAFMFVHPEDIPHIKNAFIQIIEHPEKGVTSEVRLQHKNGSWIWIEASLRNMLAEPSIGAILVSFKDTTERKQNELKLRQLSQVVEQSPISIVITDLDGTIEYVNPRFTQLTGFTLEETIGRNSRLLQSGKTSPETFRGLWNTIEAGNEWHGEFVNRKKNGEIFVERASISPVINEQGKITHFLALKEDITEQKRAAESLQASEARYRTLFEDSPVALWEEDFSAVKIFFDSLRTNEGVKDFRAYFEANPEAVSECAAKVIVRDVNKAAMRLLGAEQKEQLLGALSTIVSPQTNRAFCEELISIAAGYTHFTFEGPNIALNGETRHVSVIWSVWPGYEDTLANVTVSVVDLTDRKQAESALKESEQRFRQLFTASPDAVLVIDPRHPIDWEIVDCNTAACQMNGYTREEMINQSLDLLHQTVATAEENSALLERLRNEGVVRMEILHQHKDGHIFPIDVSTTLFTLEGRELILGIDRDITERKQAEEALRVSEERFQLVTHATNDAVWDLNLSTRERWWNIGVRPLFGYTSEQITADQAWWEAQIHPDDRPRVLASFQAALTGDGQFWSKEYRFRRADGTYAYVFDRGYIMHDNHRLPIRVIGAMMDLSERKRMEEALMKSEELFSKAFHASPAPMAITRLEDGVFIDVNDSWERLLIFSRQAVIGHRILDFNIYADAYQRATIIQQIREKGRLDSFEIKVKTSTGDERDLVMSAQIVQIQAQDCLLSTFYDITELRRMHEAMLASQKLADLGTLAAGVAHEMNSPLQVITGVSQSLLKKAECGGIEPEQLKRNLDVIHRNGWRCAEIVRSLHTYARNSGGSMAPADLNELVSDGLLLIEHQLKSWANISVRTMLTADLPPLLCDQNQITQVLINLLTNARDAMLDGGEIIIATEYDPRADQLILQITDNGLGIPTSIQNKIFDPFFTTKPLGKGTGLGLSIVAGIVRSHGGTIHVDGALPQGTTFTMRFPTKPVKLPSSDLNDVPGRFDEVVGAPLLSTKPNDFAQELSHDQDTSR